MPKIIGTSAGIGGGNFTLLVADGANASRTGATTEATMKTLTVSGGQIGANGKLILMLMTKDSGTNGTKTYRIKFGGSTIVTLTDASTFEGSQTFELVIVNRNAQNSQIMRHFAEYNTSSAENQTVEGQTDTYNSFGLYTIDTSLNQTLEVTGQLANSLDTMNIRSWFVWVIK